jgi:hypothetical protein
MLALATARMNYPKILSRYSRTQTGVVGISVVRTMKRHRTAERVYFSVHCRRPDGRKMNRKFCVSTLGKIEAWRRALKFRADHEQRVVASSYRKAVAA